LLEPLSFFVSHPLGLSLGLTRGLFMGRNSGFSLFDPIQIFRFEPRETFYLFADSLLFFTQFLDAGLGSLAGLVVFPQSRFGSFQASNLLGFGKA
jgi:hypothetical protein